jgi:hypothetical protein
VDQSYGGGPLQTQMTAREQRPYVNTREDSAVRFLGIPTVMRSTGETTNGAFGLIEHLMIPPGGLRHTTPTILKMKRFTSLTLFRTVGGNREQLCFRRRLLRHRNTPRPRHGEASAGHSVGSLTGEWGPKPAGIGVGG